MNFLKKPSKTRAIPEIGYPSSRRQDQTPIYQQPPRSQPAISAPEVKKRATDKLITDCYSKKIRGDDGRPCIETSYQAHINVKEFASYQSAPPPNNIPPQQIGSVKDRVLVLCIKHTGRVFLQKGKFNDAKRVYQIGRTWDLDELSAITKVGLDGIMFRLNRDYFWKVPEGPEKLAKFVKYVSGAYGSYVGRYPMLNGFSVVELRLPPKPVKREHDSGSRDSKEQQWQQSSRQRVSGNKPEDYYKDLDFSLNGKLPMKPMRVMDVDRPSLVTDGSKQPANVSLPLSAGREQDKEGVTNQDRRNSPPQSITANESTFVFHSVSPEKLKDNESEVMPGAFLPDNGLIHKFDFSAGQKEEPQEESREGAGYESRAERQSREIFAAYESEGQQESKERFPSYGAKDGQGPKESFPEYESTDAPSSSRINRKKSSDNLFFEKPPNKTQLDPYSPDFGIEEVDDSDGEPKVKQSDEKEKGLAITDPVRQSFIEEADLNDPIDSSIQDIENYMDSNLNFDPNEGEPRNFSDVESARSRENILGNFESKSARELVHRESVSSNISMFDFQESIDASNRDLDAEKDPEIEEFLDEINWRPSTGTSHLVQKLSKELDNMKLQNVRQLVRFDTNRNSISADANASLEEVESLYHIFKKMEIQFRLISSEINLIENDSKGLQVKSINQKVLYNDLNAILNKVTVDEKDLAIIRNFRDFSNLQKVEALENKLLRLFNALTTIAIERNDEFSSMRALGQYQSTYEEVASTFIASFKVFMKSQFEHFANLFTRNIGSFGISALQDQLGRLLVHSGLVLFVKNISRDDFRDLSMTFNQLFSALLEKVVSTRARNIKMTESTSRRSSQYEGYSPLKKPFSLRFSGKKNKNDDVASNGQDSESTKEIDDPRIIMDLVNETKKIIFVVQNFIGIMFHYDMDGMDYNEYCSTYSFRDLCDQYNSSVELSGGKNYSSDIVSHMTVVFTSYINVFLKKINISVTIIPLVLSLIEDWFTEKMDSNQEFLIFGFLKKVTDRLRNVWSKYVAYRVEQFDKSIIVTDSGVLPAIKSTNLFITQTESTLEHPSKTLGYANIDLVRPMMDESYKAIIDAAIHLFMRDDPLLKNNEFDEKEREHRNVSVIQNAYYFSEQISIYENQGISRQKAKLESVLNKVLDEYFNKLLLKNVGKLVDFVNNYESFIKMNKGKPQKYNKKYVKSLLSSYTTKELSSKLNDIYRKMEKHFIKGNDALEKDLLDKLWVKMEDLISSYFVRLNNILKTNFDKEVEGTYSRQDIHSIFKSIH